ncbi:hypothetical protein [Gottfriedia acidiceleris]|uniref:N-acetyltransferase domain-containing protein n=1 Tax=Gottfriedia acidiceleris TaxID=371036 RepID=A0ABY4JR91_9BACI|nr:hypothetical protein [Gottfriedia acidiceleris]UPM56371.1 hypothetical protein MY490_11260 [Gottfriedia acidiceleris]
MNYIEKKLLAKFEYQKSLVPEREFVGFKTTKKAEIVLLSKIEKDDFLFLTITSYQNDNFRDFQSSISIFTESLTNEIYSYINDIQILDNEDVSKGYGSLFLEFIINWSKIRGIKTIKGHAVAHNNEEKIRQNNFYTKYGFSFDEKRMIELNLN